MSRPYTTQPGRSARRSPDDDDANARQQSRVLAWVVGSAVAMHLLVVVGVLWLARAQGLEQASTAANAPTHHNPSATVANSLLTVRTQAEAVAVATPALAPAPEQPTHWSTAQSKDQAAPWRVDAHGHVVLNRTR